MIAITGGSGFFGFHAADYLARKGEASLLLDIAPHDPADYPEGTQYAEVDVRYLPELRDALSGRDVTCIVHAAAALPLWKREDIFSVNVEGTRAVLTAAKELGIPRVVVISSTAVYGVPKVHPLTEDMPMVGVGCYGESKIQAEQVCRQLRELGLCVPVIRPKTFIGTGRLGVFQILCDWVESGAKIPMIGRGGNTYQLLDVEDLCQAIYLGLTEPAEKVNDTFNVGSHDLRPVKEYVGELCEYAGTGSKPMGTPAGPVILLLRILEALHL